MLPGNDINLGVGLEQVRGTPVAPQTFIPARTPTGIAPVLEKVLIQETRASRVNSQGSEIVQKRVEGDLEFNLRSNSIGYLLKSLLGSVTTVDLGSGVYRHTFKVDKSNVKTPTLTLGLSQPGFNDYETERAVVTELGIQTPVDDLVQANSSFIGAKQNDKGQDHYEVSFDENDHYFRHQDAKVKFASGLAGLNAASSLDLKEYDFGVMNNGRVNQNIGELNPSDILALMFEISGSFALDLQSTNLHDFFEAGTRRAMRLDLVNEDVNLGGGNNPRLKIDLPHITFENWTPDRPLDDIAMENLEYTAHYDDEEDEAIIVELTNTVESYEVAGS